MVDLRCADENVVEIDPARRRSSVAEHQWCDPELVRVGVWMTRTQFREISIRAAVGPFDGRARGEYIVGCLFGEREDDLLSRVAEIRDADRARFRSVIEADQVASHTNGSARVVELVPRQAARN